MLVILFTYIFFSIINGIMFISTLRKYEKINLIMAAYLEDVRIRGGKLPNVLPFSRIIRGSKK